MRIARVDVHGEAHDAIIEGDIAYHLEGTPFENPHRGAEIGPVAGLKLLAPCQPTKIVCIGLNYKAHIEETNSTAPTEPLMFFKPPTAVVGHEDDVHWIPGTEKMDYESELALVFGKKAKFVAPGTYRDYVLGYTCANDISARDFQRGDGQWTRGKGSDTFCPLGPWIVTDIDAEDLHIGGALNGEVRQDSRTSDLLFGLDELVVHVTKYFTMLPGDVIITGTPSGVGTSKGLMKPGDVYEVTIEGIGTLRNRIVGLHGEIA